MNEVATALMNQLPISRTGQLDDPAPSIQQRTDFKISSVISGQANRYNIKTYSIKANKSASGNLAESDIGTASTTENAVAWDASGIAIGNTTSILAVGGIYSGRIVGSNSSGKPIILFSSTPVGSTSSATTFSPSGLTADTTTWSRVSNGTPVTVNVVMRVVYDSSGHSYYQFTRAFSYDAAGLLISISGETKSDIVDLVSGSCM